MSLGFLAGYECHILTTISFVCIGLYYFSGKYGENAELKRLRDLLASERQGRITAEKRLRTLLQGGKDDTGQSIKIPGKDRLTPIGHIVSPFKKRTGTPRQGGLVPSVRSRIVMDIKRTAPQDSLIGIEEYSHLWILWEFNLNTNIAGNVKAKVVPPRANGLKVGLYATRTPHRHNNIGLSLVTVLSVSKDRKSIIVGGADLIDGTPILDIKPYTPAFESVPAATVPKWVGTTVESIFEQVEWTSGSRQQVHDIVNTGSLEFYESGEGDALCDTLSELCQLQDFRSKHQRDNIKAKSYNFEYDLLSIEIEIVQKDTTITLESTKNVANKAISPRSRSVSKQRIIDVESEQKDTNEEKNTNGEYRYSSEKIISNINNHDAIIIITNVQISEEGKKLLDKKKKKEIIQK